MKRKDRKYRGTYGLFLGFEVSLSIWLRWAKDRFMEGQMVYYRDNSHRHRRSMRYIDMMRLLGDRDDYIFTREAKPIGRFKRGKWLYTPRRVLLGVK